ncbi:MAG: reverse transcriptase family protein [Microcella sp.]
MADRERLDPGFYLDLDDLVRVSGVPEAYLRQSIDRKHNPYRLKTVRKRTGGVRNVEIPRPEIAAVQSVILRDILTTKSPSKYAFAYARGKSSVDCARQHLGARWLMRVDLKGFFHSITEVDAYYLFLKEFGYRHLTSFQLARLVTTTLPGSLEESELDLERERPHISEYRSRYVAGYIPQVLGHLPHGSPTSGAISNLVTRQLDEEVGQLASDNGLVFTRYSDDIYLSARSPIERLESQGILSAVTAAIRGNGFVVNPAKTRISLSGDRKLVLGIHVDGERLRLRKDFRDRVDYELHMIRKHGVESHARKRGHANPTFLLGRVSGLIAHAQNVDPEWGRTRRILFRELLPAAKESETLIHSALAYRRERRRLG